MAYDQSVRKLLNSKGVQNSDIGYDANTGFVQVKGQNFIKPQKTYSGTSFTDQANFNNAYSTYTKNSQSSPYQGEIFNPADAGQSAVQRLTTYATDPTKGQSELDRANKAYNVYNAAGDTQRAGSAQKWIGQVQKAAGVTPGQPSIDPRLQSTVDTLMNKINNPQTIDPYSTPAYQAAMAQQQRASQDGIRASQEALGAAGFGRSTTLGESAQRIQNDSDNYLMTQVVPQILAQEEAKKQQEFMNQTSLINSLLAVDKNQYDKAQNVIKNRNDDKKANLDAANIVSQMTGKAINPQEDWSGLYRQANDPNAPLSMAGQNQNFNQNTALSSLTGMINGKPTTAEQQRIIENEWKVAMQTGAITPKLSQWYGIPEGTQTIDAMQVAISKQNANTSSQQQELDEDFRWTQLDSKLEQDGGDSNYKGMTPAQVVDNVRARYFDSDGSPLESAPSKEQLYLDVINFGLPEDQENQAFAAMGLSKNDVASFDKKHLSGK